MAFAGIALEWREHCVQTPVVLAEVCLHERQPCIFVGRFNKKMVPYQVVFMCILLLTICHIHWFESCYDSTDWRRKCQVDRSLFVGNIKHGIYSVKRGSQCFAPSPTEVLQPGQDQMLFQHNLLKCNHCKSRSHHIVTCPIVQCVKCNEFGHVSFSCKKTFWKNKLRTCWTHPTCAPRRWSSLCSSS